MKMDEYCGERDIKNKGGKILKVGKKMKFLCLVLQQLHHHQTDGVGFSELLNSIP